MGPPNPVSGDVKGKKYWKAHRSCVKTEPEIRVNEDGKGSPKTPDAARGKNATFLRGFSVVIDLSAS